MTHAVAMIVPSTTQARASLRAARAAGVAVSGEDDGSIGRVMRDWEHQRRSLLRELQAKVIYILTYEGRYGAGTYLDCERCLQASVERPRPHLSNTTDCVPLLVCRSSTDQTGSGTHISQTLRQLQCRRSQGQPPRH